MRLIGPPDVEKLQSKGNVKGLIKALNHKLSDVRQAAAIALMQIEDARAVEPLIAMVKDNDRDVRCAATEALGKIGDVHAVESLIETLIDDDKTVRVKAAWSLGQIGDVRAVDPLIIALQDEDVRVRKETIAALGLIGDSSALDPLIAILKGDEQTVRLKAAWALGQIGDTRGVEPLIAIIKDIKEVWHIPDEVAIIVTYVANALVQIGTPAVKPLILVLKGRNILARDVAAWTLGKIGDPQSGGAVALFRSSQTTAYNLNRTCLDNPLGPLNVATLRECVYCKFLRDPNLRETDYPIGEGECSNYNSPTSVVSLDDFCWLWKPNTKVRFWLSKGYMEHNLEGWPRKPWYQVFNDGPDGEKGTR